MSRSPFRPASPAFDRPTIASSITRLLAGCCSAIYLFAWCHQVLALLGTSPLVTTAMGAAIIAGVVAAARCRALPLFAAIPRNLLSAAMQLGLATFAVFYPVLIDAAGWVLAHPGLIRLDSAAWTPAWNGGVLFVLAVLLLGLPAFFITLLACGSRSEAASPVVSGAWFVCGAAFGIALGGFVLAPIMGLYYTALVAAACGAVAAVASLIRPELEVSGAGSCRADWAPAAANVVPVDAQLQQDRFGRGVEWLAESAVMAVLGGMLAGCVRMTHQLSPTSTYALCAEWAGILCGAGMGLAFTGWREKRPTSFESAKIQAGPARTQACWGLALWCVGLIAAFPWLVRGSLWLNAYTEQTELLLMARALLSAIVLMPIGFAFAVCASSRQGGARGISPGAAVPPSTLGFSRPDPHLAWPASLVCVLFGFQFVRWEMLPTHGPAVTLIALAWGLCPLAAGRWLHWGDLHSTWARRGAVAGTVSLLAVAPLWRANYAPALSARTLFTTNVFLAYRNGFDNTLLPFLDEGRNVAQRETGRSTFTLWKYGGRQLQLRENGVPKGVASTDPEVYPQFAPELLQAAFPLILHERPQRLLLLGLGSSMPLAAGLSFPIQKVVCAEGDAGFIDLLREAVPSDGVCPLDDDRVTTIRLDPALMLPAGRETFDVIVSSPDQAALLQSQACFTAEFYGNAARRLKPDGIFCQRVQFVDLGPDALRSVTRTLQTAFPTVLAVELAPGELLFFGTRDARGLVRPGLLARAAAPQVRRLTAQLGFDWSVLLNLAAYSQADLELFAAEKPAAPNTIADGRAAFLLPKEVMRWGVKLQEVQAALAKRGGRLADWMGDEGESKILVRRLAEVNGQQDLMVKYADQYWAYRASVREQITANPLSKIQRASFDERRGLHPEDQRRLDYFTVLGRAVRSRSPEDISRLSAFEKPYDPLLSYFVHQEVAELYAQSATRDEARELRHRLHTIYFASPRDGAVRSTIDALQLLRDRPDAEPDAVQRWDQMNALLQMLQVRWAARAGIAPSTTQAVLGDIDATIIAAERTFGAMDALAAEAGVSPERWTARRRTLEKTLIRPLRDYRTQILPLHHKHKLTQHAVGKKEGGAK